MSGKDYDKITAFHYKAYRPPLHTLILKKYLLDATFKKGLDIGCGTGKSTTALKQICETAIGVDPNFAMLNNAILSEGITYKHFDGKHLNLAPSTFDIITLAGSWWYGKSQTLLNEICLVSTLDATIVLYDFEVLLAPVYQVLQLEFSSIQSSYDHFIDFSDFNSKGFELIDKTSEKIGLKVSSKELAHLLFSEKKTLSLLEEKYGYSNTFETVNSVLENNYGKYKIEVPTKIYYTKYSVIEV